MAIDLYRQILRDIYIPSQKQSFGIYLRDK